MNFPIFETKINSKLREFVPFWSNCYIDPREKFYTTTLNKNKLIANDIRLLFEWKNGGKLSRIKAKIVDSIIGKINIVNKLKENFNQDIFDNEFCFIKGAIWKIFLLHVINQKKFPIFDQHVYRSYCFLTEGKIKEIPYVNAAKEKFYFDIYVNFFNELVAKGVNRKKLDEALWAFGKFLKTPYGNKV